MLDRRLRFGGWALAAALTFSWPAARSLGEEIHSPEPPEPQPIVAGAKVVTLWPKGSPKLKELAGSDQP